MKYLNGDKNPNIKMVIIYDAEVKSHLLTSGQLLKS